MGISNCFGVSIYALFEHISAGGKGNERMKKKVLICTLLAICLSVAAYGTTAFFSYEDTATNVIVAGDVKIRLQEWSVPEDGGAPVPFEDVTDVMPGTKVSKIVEVKNTGKNAAWIRIAVAKSILLAEGVTGEADLSLVTLDLNKDHWTEKDGYYYYHTALAPGETTEPLFTAVAFAREMGNMYQYSKAVVTVQAQATQVVHNGLSVFEAAGWPDTE